VVRISSVALICDGPLDLIDTCARCGGGTFRGAAEEHLLVEDAAAGADCALGEHLRAHLIRKARTILIRRVARHAGGTRAATARARVARGTCAARAAAGASHTRVAAGASH